MRSGGRVDLTLNLTPQDVIIRLRHHAGDGTRPVTAEIRGLIDLPQSGLRLLSFTNVGERKPAVQKPLRPFVIRRELGHVIVRGLFPGRYSVSLQGARYFPYRKNFELQNRPLRIDAVLRPGFPVRLPFPDGESRAPLRGPATVIVLRGDEEVYRTFEVIGEEVFIPVLRPGTYRMSILGEDGETFSRRFEVD